MGGRLERTLSNLTEFGKKSAYSFFSLEEAKSTFQSGFPANSVNGLSENADWW